ncbi:MAG: hypothetical protein ACPHRC_09640 [Candidatus Puniceispirillales bacterium]
MKITKLKKGYRINLTDTEMSLLRLTQEEGYTAYIEMHDEDTTGLNAPEKRILTEIKNGEREWL